MIYLIKQIVVTEPKVKLPEGSQVVSVKHRNAHRLTDVAMEIPEEWQVIYLEPEGT